MESCNRERIKRGLKPCKATHVCNPETGRCVKRTGDIGKKILGQSKSRRSRSKSVRKSRSKSVRKSRSKSVRKSRSKSVRKSKSKSVRKSKSKSVRKSKSKSVRKKPIVSMANIDSFCLKVMTQYKKYLNKLKESQLSDFGNKFVFYIFRKGSTRLILLGETHSDESLKTGLPVKGFRNVTRKLIRTFAVPTAFKKIIAIELPVLGSWSTNQLAISEAEADNYEIVDSGAGRLLDYNKGIYYFIDETGNKVYFSVLKPNVLKKGNYPSSGASINQQVFKVKKNLLESNTNLSRGEPVNAIYIDAKKKRKRNKEACDMVNKLERNNKNSVIFFPIGLVHLNSKRNMVSLPDELERSGWVRKHEIGVKINWSCPYCGVINKYNNKYCLVCNRLQPPKLSSKSSYD